MILLFLISLLFILVEAQNNTSEFYISEKRELFAISVSITTFFIFILFGIYIVWSSRNIKPRDNLEYV